MWKDAAKSLPDNRALARKRLELLENHFLKGRTTERQVHRNHRKRHAQRVHLEVGGPTTDKTCCT